MLYLVKYQGALTVSFQKLRQHRSALKFLAFFSSLHIFSEDNGEEEFICSLSSSRVRRGREGWSGEAVAAEAGSCVA